MEKDIIVGISQGDINGIGYEIIIKAFLDGRLAELCTPIVYGSPKVAAYHRKALNIENLNFNSIREPEEAARKKLNLINCLDDSVRVEFGQATEHSGEAAFISLDRAVADLKEGKIDILVTAPIDKHAIQSEKFRFPGHTEFLQEKFEVTETLMLMVSDTIKVGVVTGHIPLKEVAGKVTTKAILSKLKLLNQSLIQDFGIRKPRIALLGLNPHAGDSGLLGDEETTVIAEALKKAADMDILAFGPFPADGFFGSGSFTKFDAVLAMYHDQGLAPFKAISFDEGVNFTAGLPVIRTSPPHGTGHNIAGKGEASENGFRKAVYLAIDIYRNRKMYSEIMANPLGLQNIDTLSGATEDLPPDEENNNNPLL